LTTLAYWAIGRISRPMISFACGVILAGRGTAKRGALVVRAFGY